MPAKPLLFLAAALLCGTVAAGLSGCTSAPVYHIDYNGEEFCYEKAPTDFRAGDKVKLYYTLIATDTDYAFYLDDERIHPDYDWQKGFIIEFTMPDHDVSLRVESYNLMVFVPDDGERDESGGEYEAAE